MIISVINTTGTPILTAPTVGDAYTAITHHFELTSEAISDHRNGSPIAAVADLTLEADTGWTCSVPALIAYPQAAEDNCRMERCYTFHESIGGAPEWMREQVNATRKTLGKAPIPRVETDLADAKARLLAALA